MQLQSLETHAKMQTNHDRQWIHTAVAFIKAYMEDGSKDLLDGLIDKDAYLKRLMNIIVENSNKIDGGQFSWQHS